jgi:hypothetical protein
MKNGFQTQNNNVNPTAEQIKRRNKLHKEATKQADKSFSAACKAQVYQDAFSARDPEGTPVVP